MRVQSLLSQMDKVLNYTISYQELFTMVDAQSGSIKEYVQRLQQPYEAVLAALQTLATFGIVKPYTATTVSGKELLWELVHPRDRDEVQLQLGFEALLRKQTADLHLQQYQERYPVTLPDCIESEEIKLGMRKVYTFVDMAWKLLDANPALKKSQLLNNTISMVQRFNAYAATFQEHDKDEEGSWLVIIEEDPYNNLEPASRDSMKVLGVFEGKYYDIVRMALCIKQVHEIVEMYVPSVVNDYVKIQKIYQSK